jgi:hypothetical protein
MTFLYAKAQDDFSSFFLVSTVYKAVMKTSKNFRENLPKKTLKTYKSFFFLNAEMDIVAFMTKVKIDEKTRNCFVNAAK